MSNQIQLYWETARHLKPIQIWRRMWCPAPWPQLQSAQIAPRNRVGEWTTPIRHRNPWLGGSRWRHLNQEREIRTWNDSGVEKLWLYHLHYLDSPCAETVRRWINENPPGIGNGWEPYPVSRRISNWVGWLIEGSLSQDLVRHVGSSLAFQMEWLSRRMEWHLLGNHLLANAKALVMGGAYFSGGIADRWLREGLEILRRELQEQVLADGAHLELSPMYHALVLEDILDLINLAGVYRPTFAHEENEWRKIAGRMLGWLAHLTHPDGQVAYFNDSVQGLAPTLKQLRLYAERLGVTEERVPLGPSGYVRVESGNTIVLFDAGQIGPDYQPGHGHCDLLSIEISYEGRRVIANSGVSTYDPGPQRLAERRTAAHNTLRVDNVEQSDVWGSFRVGRRARVLKSTTGNRSWASGAHDGYRLLKGSVTHRRRVEISNGKVTVVDRLEGVGHHTAEVFWHPAPGASVEIEFDDFLSRREERGWWCAGFNLRVDRPTIVGVWRGHLPVDLTTHLRFL
jgi:uncharacterized heparinase superfamily protein